jgi:very-short-patch-repair endonuclease
MSRVTSQARLFRLIKDAEFRKEIRVPELAAILERYPRRRGRRNLAAIVDPLTAASRPTRSPLEDRFVGFCARRGLPLPETNVDLTVGGRRYQADCLWRDARVIVELDGRDAHARELAFEDDRARDRALATAGWVPVRVTTAQLDFDGDRLENELRALRCTWRLGESRGIDHT